MLQIQQTPNIFSVYAQTRDALNQIQKGRLANQLSQMQNNVFMQNNAIKNALLQAETGNYNADTGYKNVQTQYYGPEAMSRIGLQGAQAQDAMANAGYTNAQTQAYPSIAASENALRGAQTTRENALSQLPGGGNLTGPAGFVAGVEYLRQRFGDNSPQYRTAAAMLGQKTGMQGIGGVQQQPAGGYIGPNGFVMPQQNQQPIQASPQGQPGNLMTSPASVHSRNSNAGSTLMDTNTGEAISVPTTKTASSLQSAITAGRIISPTLSNVFQKVAPMLGTQNLPKYLEQRAGQFLGMQEPELENYQSATRAIIPQNADAMVKELGLNTTNENVAMMKNAMMPQSGDTPTSWARRLADMAAGIASREGNYSQMLRGGVPLKQGMSQQEVTSAISDKIYTDMMRSIDPSLNTPQFKSKADEIAWFKQQPRDVQEHYLSSKG